ncbi:MAG: putative Ig domain-containing protein [Planctomycetes bacterium]|nr:putative Ig domain-containing protein [Planctomycetota bacterium]
MYRLLGLTALALTLCGVLSGALCAQNPGVLYYKFNEGTGNTTANLGAQGTATATFSAAPTWETPGQVGAADVDFTGTYALPTGYNANVTAGSWTIEVWVRVGAAGANPNYICGDVGHTGFRLFVHGIALSGAILRGAGLQDVPIVGALDDNAWHHVAFVHDAGTQTTTSYLDGAQDSQVTAQVPAAAAGTGFLIGGYNTTGFVGGLDEFRFWNVARSGAQISANTGIEIGQSTPEINVIDPNGDPVASGGSHRIDPVSPSGNGTFSWTIQNLHPTVGLNIGTVVVTPGAGCTTSISANPSSTTVAGGGSTILSILVTGSAGTGTLSFTISIPSNDANENPYTITVNGSRGLSGSFTINNGGGGDYTDIGAAFDDLEDLGVVGNVTFTIFDNGSGYAANPSYELGSDGGFVTPQTVLGTGANSITFVAASGASPVISGNFPINLFGQTSFGIVSMALTDVSNISIIGLSFNGTTDANLFIYQDAILPGGTVNVSRCKFSGNISGMAVAGLANGQALTGFTFENNFVWDCGPTGSVLHTGLTIPQNGMLSLFNPDSTCRVEHNTFLLTSFGFPTSAGCCVGISGGLSDLGSLMYNIIYTTVANTKLVSIPPGLEPVASNRNIFYYPSGLATFSTDYASLATWRTASGLDANSLSSNPALVSITGGSADLHLLGTSAAIGGAVGSTATTDVDGEARPQPAATTNDIGADETPLTGGPGPANLQITGPVSLPNGSLGATWGPATITASGGTPGYTWSAIGLPTGLTINPATGEITGMPTASGTFNVTVTVTDNGAPPQTAIRAYTFDVVAAGTLLITTAASLPGGTQNQSYSTNIVAINGVGNHTWSVSAGPLPAGLSLGASATGTVVLSGTPTASGTFNFTIQVMDSDAPPETDVQAFSLVIAPGSGSGTGSLGGGGGGGGGCAADAGNSHWLMLVGLLAMLGVVGTFRARKQ